MGQTKRMQATARMTSIVSSALPARRRLIRSVSQRKIRNPRLRCLEWVAQGDRRRSEAFPTNALNVNGLHQLGRTVLFSKPHNDGWPMGIRGGRSRGAEQTSPRCSIAHHVQSCLPRTSVTHPKQRSAKNPRMKTLIIIAILCGAFLSAAAQDPSKIDVKLIIRGNGKSGLEAEVRSYFTREFRAIRDVEVTDEKALMVVNVVIVEARHNDGQRSGYIMSLAITDKMPVLALALGGELSTTDPEKKKQMAHLIPEGGILVDHILEVLDTESLAKSCKELVAVIDGSHLEEVRKWRHALQKMMPNQAK